MGLRVMSNGIGSDSEKVNNPGLSQTVKKVEPNEKLPHKSFGLIADALVRRAILNPVAAARAFRRAHNKCPQEFKDYIKGSFLKSMTSFAASVSNKVDANILLKHQSALMRLDSQRFSEYNIYAKGIMDGRIDEDSAKDYLARLMGCPKEDLKNYSAKFIISQGTPKFMNLCQEDKRQNEELQKDNSQSSSDTVNSQDAARAEDIKLQKRNRSINQSNKHPEKAAKSGIIPLSTSPFRNKDKEDYNKEDSYEFAGEALEGEIKGIASQISFDGFSAGNNQNYKNWFYRS